MSLRIEGNSIKVTVYFNICNGVAVRPECKGAFSSSAAYMVPDDKSPCVNLLPRSLAENTFDFFYSSSISFGIKIRKKNSFDFIVVIENNEFLDKPVVSAQSDGILIATNDIFVQANPVAKIFSHTKNFCCFFLTLFGLFLLFSPLIQPHVSVITLDGNFVLFLFLYMLAFYGI
jgi:hypothetical protein